MWTVFADIFLFLGLWFVIALLIFFVFWRFMPRQAARSLTDSETRFLQELELERARLRSEAQHWYADADLAPEELEHRRQAARRGEVMTHTEAMEQARQRKSDRPEPF